MTDAPWEMSDEFLNENKIDFVAHDEIPYTSDNTQDIYAKVKERGMFVATERTEGNLLLKIIEKSSRKMTQCGV